MVLRNRSDNIPFARTNRYVNSFFPYTIEGWKNLDEEAKKKPSVANFKKHLNKYIRPPGYSFFGLTDKFGIKLLTKFSVGFPTYVATGSIIILTANGLVAAVGSMTKLQLISSYAVRCSLMNGLHSLARFQT